MLNKKLEYSFNIKPVREKKQYYIMTDDSPSRNTFNKLSFPTISDYDGLEQKTECQNSLDTNFNVRALHLS